VSWHGVTTALIGNCGMTFAPCRPSDRPLLAGMMETVEDIPKEAILGGLAWDWEQYPEYLDSIERLGTAVNVAGLIGHAAVRYYVMGERSFDSQATEEELEEMARIVAIAVEQGAFGFSTNRFEPHVAPDGRSIPGTFADVRELERITEVVAPRGGLMQLVGADFDCLRAVGDKPNARVLFSYGQSGVPGAGREAAKRLDALCEGRDVTAISHVRGSGYMFGLQAGLPFRGHAWRELYEKDLNGRLAAIRDPAFAARLVEEARLPDCARVVVNDVYFLGAGATPDYTNTVSLTETADAAGEHWAETFLRLSSESDGRGLFLYRMFSKDIDEQADLFKSSHIYPGLGDAGAHVAQVMDAGWSSFLLSYWTRERGEFSLPDVIQKMTSGPARVVGLTDRGTLAVGQRADLNVFDLNTVGERQPELVHDFPNEAPRFIQKSNGFKATIVNGVVSLLDGELTGQRAGHILRHSA
ncbi:MAG TPA: amidohydrolase family protein, partial [Pseudomonadales bacterium]